MSEEEIKRFVPPPLKSDIVFARRTFRGRVYYVAKNKLAEKYFRLSPEEAKVALWFNGVHTVGQIAERVREAFPHLNQAAVDIFSFYQRLASANLLLDSPEVFVHRRRAIEKVKSSWFALWSRAVGSLLAIRIPLLNPNSWIGRFAPFWRVLFTPWAFLVFVVLWGYVLVGITLSASQGAETGFSFLDGFSFPLLWLGLAFSKTFHELGHAATCKAFGGNVNEMGLTLICLAPCGYVDASDAWMMDSRWKRLAVSAAGVYTELFIGGIAGFIWLHTSDGVLHSFAFGLFLIASVNTLLFNLNPLMRFDGYYVASDLLDIPNLRSKSMGWVGGQIKHLFFGTPRPEKQDGAGWIFTLYAFAAFGYILVISFSIGFVFLRILGPVGLQDLGIWLGVVVFVSLLGLPILQAFREISASRMKLATSRPFSRSFLVFAIIAAVLCLLALLPTRHVVRTQGIVESSIVYTARAPVSGVLEAMLVEEGQRVREGQPLFRFENEDLRFARNRVLASMRRERILLRRKSSDSVAIVNRSATVHNENLSRLGSALQRIDNQLAALTVVSGVDGVVTSRISDGLQRLNGVAFPRGAEVLRVSGPGRTRILAAIPERDARIVESGDEAGGAVMGSGQRISLIVGSVGSRLAESHEVRGGHLLPNGGDVPVGVGPDPTPAGMELYPVVIVNLSPVSDQDCPLRDLVPGQRVRLRIEGASTTFAGRVWRRISLFWEDRTG